MRTAVVAIGLCCLTGSTFGQALKSTFAPIIRDCCIHCHDADTTTRLDFEKLRYDLTDAATFRQWLKIYDQLRTGDMPPKSEPRPDEKLFESAVSQLKQGLRSANLKARKVHGRVPARRLTRLEFEYSLRDLLSIEGDFQDLLPQESSAASFDTVGAEQNFSALHLEGVVVAADRAIDATIRLDENPHRTHKFDLLNNQHLNSFHDRDIRAGGNISRKLEDGVAIFRDVDYLLRSDLHGFKVRTSGSGYYRIRVTAEAFQAATPVTLKVVVKDVSGESRLVTARDLVPGAPQTFEVNAWLTRTKVFYISMAEERSPRYILADIYGAGGATNYKGRGIAVKSVHVDGPLTEGWPPKSTQTLLAGVNLSKNDDGSYRTDVSKSTLADVRQVIARIAPRAFRRSLEDDEMAGFVNLAKPAIAQGQNFVDTIRVPLRAVFSSPHFLLLTGKAGPLDDYSLASRLSYFLWKTIPDEELLRLAEAGRLSDPDVLHAQVDRMLLDDRSMRFVRDFAGQWLRLKEIEATTPDEKLYPEYDQLLHWSVAQETNLFLSHLINKNLSVRNLIDSEFTFLNRRLAEHYDIDSVTGQELRRVELPVDSPRGGVLTQAGILKVTANGLVTSPVRRGAFVLSDLLGTPPPPPPANVGSIEPDTSGATSIRETLVRHRTVESCAKCHRLIDPPGFALECFDPIGGFRVRYRKRFDDLLSVVKYQDGPAVDCRGITPQGNAFAGIKEFKLLLMQQKEQLARHLISQLMVYSTGGEIEFVDRDEVEDILNRTREADFPFRTILQQVVQSAVFRNR